MRVIAETGPPWVENDSQSGPCVHGMVRNPNGVLASRLQSLSRLETAKGKATHRAPARECLPANGECFGTNQPIPLQADLSGMWFGP